MDFLPASDPLRERVGRFLTTDWNIVLSAKDSNAPGATKALTALCENYWYPLYVYVRRRGYSEHDARDLIQEFFWRLLDKAFLDSVDPARGRFRSFLLGAINHFLAKEWARAHRQKRGGEFTLVSFDEDVEERYRAEAANPRTPERAYERRWALQLIESTMKKLAVEATAAGKERLFEELMPLISGDETDRTYAQVAEGCEMTEAAVKMAALRLRKRYGELLRAQIASTVSHPDEVEDEIRFLFAAVRSG
jgi:RNA polymerase sigma-70 factor (ECF subfamily)